MLRKVMFSIILITIISLFPSALGFEPIIITISDTMNSLDLDGKWTHPREWKKSSLNEFKYEDETKIILRSAHQGDFVYIFLDALTDKTLDTNSDRAIICFDTQNNKSTTSDKDDYCFMAILENNSGYTLQGGSSIALNGHFEKISNHNDTFALSSISDENDRYVKIPHASYEFKIPTEVIQRNNIYGFYFQVYDATTKTTYEYPQNINHISMVKIPSPSLWGEIISPDKSIPEFNLPLLTMILSIVVILFFTRIKNQKSFSIKQLN